MKGWCLWPVPCTHWGFRVNLGYKDLEMHTLFLPKGDCGYRMPVERALTQKQIDSVVIMAFNDVEAVKSSVKSGREITVIPEIAVRDDLHSGELVPLPWED